MAEPYSSSDVDFYGSAMYRIVVNGRVPEHWSDRLGGLDITINSDERRCQWQTVLEGAVSDQAQLKGVLDSLYELHLPIVSVTHES